MIGKRELRHLQSGCTRHIAVIEKGNVLGRLMGGVARRFAGIPPTTGTFIPNYRVEL